MAEPDARRGRLTLLLIIAVFLIPLVAAYLYRPTGEPGNHGRLVDPPHPLEAFDMTGVDGEPAGLDTLTGKWSLIYLGGGECGEPCRDSLYKIERVRLTQGKHMDRVQALYLAPQSMAADTMSETLVQFKGLEGYRLTPAQLEAMAPGYDLSAGDNRIYLVDPLGNLMMFYPAEADPNGMKDDLKRLLKVSQIG